MPDIEGISGVAVANIESLSGKAIANVAKFGGVTKAAAASLPSQSSYLLGWWDPSDASVNDTTLDSRCYTESVGVGSNINHYQLARPNTETHITSLSSVNCWYLDGSGDRVYVNGYNDTGTNWPLNTDFTEWTIEGWVRSNGSWLSNGNWWNIGYNNAYRNRFDSGKRLWNYWIGLSYTTSTTFDINTWHHIAITVTPRSGVSTQYGTAKIYKNGSLVHTVSNINRDPNQAGRTCFWGGFTSTKESQRMYMGVHRIYTVALTGSEISDNYDLEKSTYGHS